MTATATVTLTVGGAVPCRERGRTRFGAWAVAMSLVTTLWLGACASTGPTARRITPAQADALAATPLLADVTTVGTRGQSLGAAARDKVVTDLKGEGDAVLMARQLAVATRDGDVPLYRGNATRLLIDGPQAFAAMFAAIEAARHSVLLESYIIEDQALATRLADLLIQKRAAGVTSAMLYDDLGSLATAPAYFQRLRDHGVAVCAYNPVNPVSRLGYWGIANRDHRKILVVDDQVAFTGGINISQVYASRSRGSGGSGRSGGGSGGSSGSGSGGSSTGSFRTAFYTGSEATQAPTEGWRDTQIQLDGPAASRLADLVRETWRAQGCDGVLPPPAGPGATTRGDRVALVLASSPAMPDNPIYAALLAAIDSSLRSVHLTMAYFAPGNDMVDALCDAAQRGVDVTLVLPSRSDFSLVLSAGRSYYARLLKAGVRIYELQTALLHAKTAVIDGVWSTVGSSNMDWRSFADNNEANAVVLGSVFADEVEAMFRRDLADSQPVTRAQWRRRPLGDRVQEWVGRLVERLL